MTAAPRRGRGNVEDRGRSLLVEGRLVVRHVDAAQAVATVRGDSANVRRVEWRAGAGWRCSCPARGRCAHIVAAQLVLVVPDEGGC